MKHFSPKTYTLLLIIGLALGMLAMVLWSLLSRPTPTPSHDRDDVYQWAYELGITTAPTVQEANMDGLVYRKAAAKMVTVFATQVVGLRPDTSKPCDFRDIGREPPELQNYIHLACQLGLMGLDYHGQPEQFFNPNYPLTRDQFVTILSRTLFGNTYNIQANELHFFDKVTNFFVHTRANINNALHTNMYITSPFDWYSKHLAIIKKLGVMTNYTPHTKEFKGYVLLIMRRIEQLGISHLQSTYQ